MRVERDDKQRRGIIEFFHSRPKYFFLASYVHNIGNRGSKVIVN